MTNFNHAFRVTWQPKFRNLNQLLFFNLLALILTLVYQIFQHGFANLEMVSSVFLWGMGFSLAAFIWLTVQSERYLVSDTYRLLPTSDTELYLGNLASSFVGIVYFGVVQGILGLLGVAMNGTNVWQWLQHNVMNHMTTHDWHTVQVYGLAIVGYMIVIVLWIWVFITLIHFATEAISAFIPGISQKIVKFVLAIGLAWVAVAFVNWLGTLENNLVGAISHTGSVNMGLDLGLLVLLVAAVGALNIYLMQHWVEAKA